MCIEFPALDNPRFHKLFRCRFRMPYNCFKELAAMAAQSVIFDRWKPGKSDATGHESTPLPLLILCALRYIGRGWTFDDLSENTGISEEVIRGFFHKFILFGSTELYEKFVTTPNRAEEAAHHTEEYRQAGLPGCVVSMDATHILLLERVEYRLRQNHLGYKMSHTARAYNITVNHGRCILATTKGHPSQWNDKTLVLFDDFAVSLNKGRMMQDFTFELYERDGSGNVTKAKYRGPWLIVDNGYLNWPMTVPPFRSTCSRQEIRFSQCRVHFWDLERSFQNT